MLERWESDMKNIKWTLLTFALLNSVLASKELLAQPTTSSGVKHQRYAVVVLPPNGGADSLLAGYLFYAPLTPGGTVGVLADTSTPGVFNSYTWTAGRQVNLQALPQSPDLTGTNTYVNWINQWGLAAGYGTRLDPNGNSFDQAALWLPRGQVFPLQAPAGAQSHAVWVNDFGQASGWIAVNSIVDECSFGVGFQSQAVVWQFGIPRPLGTLGGTDSYGEFINDRGQISGHAQTSDVPDGITGCPPFDPFVWQYGKMIDINPGNFGGTQGGTNFLSNAGHAVGFGTLTGELSTHAFIWKGGKLTDLSTVGTLGGGQDSAFNVSERGHTVGISTTPAGTILAVLWRDGTFTNLSSLSAQGDDCSEPVRINSREQVVGASFSCETGTQHAFIWEGGQMADLDTLIPANAGLELIFANWIDDDGVIAAQAVVTAGPDSGTLRAVLLFPTGEREDEASTPSAVAPRAATIAGAAQAAAAGATPRALLKTPDGRLNPMILRPFAPAKLLGNAH
jgi:probable HAF family extracellular repeat protein